jgi:hypothetical protein
MSTDQITGSDGLLCYNDEELLSDKDFVHCERCLYFGEEDEFINFFSKKLYNAQKQKVPATVCKTCWTNYYEFYEDEYLIVNKTFKCRIKK